MDRAPIYRALAKRYGWTFTAIGQMTLAQQLIALDDRDYSVDRRTGRRTMKFGSVAEYQAWRATRE